MRAHSRSSCRESDGSNNAKGNTAAPAPDNDVDDDVVVVVDDDGA